MVQLERFSNECCKTKTKEASTASQMNEKCLLQGTKKN